MHSITRTTAVHTLGLALGLLAVTANTASAGQVYHFKNNGAYAEMSGSDSTGCIWFYVSVSRGGTMQAPETNAYYEMYNQCTSESVGWGSGRVANTSFKTSKKGATLTLSPSASADFSTSGAVGTLSITWIVDGVWSYSYSGHSRQEYAGTVYQTHGSWTYKTAKAAGTILGVEIGEAWTQIGEGRDRYMEIERSK
jgi:hypothetical protein